MLALLKNVLSKRITLLFLTVLVLLLCLFYSSYAFHTVSHSRSVPAATQISPSSEILVSPVKDNEPLSQADEQAKKSLLINSLDGVNQSGIVYKSSQVQIEYVASANGFQAEILTSQIASAKTETETWFRSEGISQRGICDLPLLFYLSADVKADLPTNDSQVSLLPDGC